MASVLNKKMHLNTYKQMVNAMINAAVGILILVSRCLRSQLETSFVVQKFIKIEAIPK